MAKRTKGDLEKALSIFQSIIAKDTGNVPALVGAAMTLYFMGQKPKAKNALKRLAKMEYNAMDADDFERGWLLLAEIYINVINLIFLILL